MLGTLRDVGLLAAGIGLFVVCLVGARVLLNVNRSLNVLHGILENSDRELRRTLPEVRETAQRINQMVGQVNYRVQAADQLVTTTGAVVNNWRQRVRDAVRAPLARIRSVFEGRRKTAGAGHAGRDLGHAWEEERT